jgi:hypothetical protein
MRFEVFESTRRAALVGFDTSVTGSGFTILRFEMPKFGRPSSDFDETGCVRSVSTSAFRRRSTGSGCGVPTPTPYTDVLRSLGVRLRCTRSASNTWCWSIFDTPGRRQLMCATVRTSGTGSARLGLPFQHDLDLDLVSEIFKVKFETLTPLSS